MKAITIKVYYAKNLFQKSRGLLDVDKPYPLYFKTRFGIHTFGMKQPIDVVVLNKHNEVIGIKERLKPNRVFLWNPSYNNVLELPPGTIRVKKFKSGLKIELLYD